MKTRIRLLVLGAAAVVTCFVLSVKGNETAANFVRAPAPPLNLRVIQTPGKGLASVTANTAPEMPPVTNQITLKFVKVDSAETNGDDGKGANAVDSNPNTFWHTQWQDDSPEHPHEIVIELVPPSTIKGFTYLPRQDDNENGTIKDYEFYVSDDGADFGQPVKKGTFEAGSDKKIVTFEPVKCRFIKLKAISEVNGEAWTSAAEIGVVLND